MRFKVDENLPDELVQLFREAGWDSTSVVQQQLGGAEDPRIEQVCDEENRILVTFDRGFANIRRYPPERHPGYIVFRLKSQDKPHVLAVSSRLIATLRSRHIRNQLWIVEEGPIRVRPQHAHSNVLLVIGALQRRARLAVKRAHAYALFAGVPFHVSVARVHKFSRSQVSDVSAVAAGTWYSAGSMSAKPTAT